VTIRTAASVLAAVCAAFVCLGPLSKEARAQSGIDYAEFKKKVEPYFAEELIEDITKAMPQGAAFKVWGYDVGDFSGDGVNDVAVSVNVLGTRRRESTVYLFIDNEGFLVNVAKFPLEYIDLPLEIGVAMRDGACYVTQKIKADHWVIKGYQYREGALVLLDDFVSDNVDSYGHERYVNYTTLESKERFLDGKGIEMAKADYLNLPAYSRGRQIVAGYRDEIVVERVRNVHEGAYWWLGPEDASFSARVVYDDDYLYLRVDVKDTSVVTGRCDTCAADRLDVWFDVTPPDSVTGSRTIGRDERGKLVFRGVSDSGLYALSIRIGDFEDVRPSVRVRTTDDLSESQQEAVQRIRVVTSLRSTGYIVKVRVPFLLFGYERVPLDERSVTEMGCTIALYDVDNEFRGDEVSVIATSAINTLQPGTYGAIRFIPDDLWYGETTNIFADAVLSYLRELGF
jgi:hypothetical protein